MTVVGLRALNYIWRGGFTLKMLPTWEAKLGTPFHRNALYDASKTEIYNDGIKILTPYKLADWVVADSKIQKINFESNTQMASITCLAFFCLADKTVHPKTFMVTDAALVYDGLLVIDHNFKTNDPCIYSAGPMTKYGRKYYAPNYYHEHYNSIEVGAEAASRFQKFVEEDDEFPPEENNCWGNTGGETDVPAVVEFTWPVIESCALLGGWHYFRARRPGPDLPLETMLNHQHDLVKNKGRNAH
ncbi:hypothetical protein AAG570_008431 [Ranatra chinensis]|uniref:Uncharacterized protein n=1 Tax=Ranatra chinensis TaxID=642074 RepID=A0ABD0Z3S6_9HEMI